ACGNTVVLKPAASTPLSALRLAAIVQDVELPPGVVNVVTGDGRTGALLVRHPGVQKVTFTGGGLAGRDVARAVAGTGKDLTLWLEGHTVHVVLDDAPLEQAVDEIV